MAEEISIAIVGGTGAMGTALAHRLAMPGIKLIIGSRDPARARAAAESLGESLAGEKPEGKSNEAAVRDAEIIVVAVPYEGHARTLTELKGEMGDKVVIDTVVPLEKGRPFIPRAGSALMEAQEILGPGAHLAGAFHHVSAVDLLVVDAPLGDVLVCGDSAWAKQKTMALIERIGARPLDGGPARHAYIIEGMTGVLIYLNRKYKSKHASLKITGIPD